MIYRIKQKFYKNDETAEIRSYYIIECLKTNLIKSFLHLERRVSWKLHKTPVRSKIGRYNEVLEFEGFEETEEYLNNLKRSERWYNNKHIKKSTN